MSSTATVALDQLWTAFHAVGARCPDKTAIVDGSVRLSYRDLAQAATRLSRDEHSSAGAVDQISLGNNAQDVIALLATAMTGRDVLVTDPRAPEPERARALDLATGPLAASDEGGADAQAEPAVLLTTSGVNGVPKVVRRSWSTITANSNAFAAAAGYGPDDVVLCTTPLSHCYAFSVGLVAALSAGATVLLERPPLTPDRFAGMVAEHRVTVVQSVPFLYRWYLSSLQGGSALRLAVSAGESLDSQLATAWYDRSGVALSDHYGTTETGTVTLNRDGQFAGVGPPLAGVELRIDGPSDDGVGEVLVRSDAGEGSYVGQRELSAVAWDGPWYRSGDVGRLDRAGELVITGRKSVRINVAGRKVDPIEVEQALRACPGVNDCAVVGVPSSLTGEEIVAHVVAEPTFSWSTTRALLAQRLSSYKVPRRVERWDDLPRTASGKVRRGLLQGGSVGISQQEETP